MNGFRRNSSRTTSSSVRMKSKKRRATVRAKRSSSTQAQKEPVVSVPPPGIADLLARGRKLHEAGRLADAEIFYRQALAAQPNNANALNLLGIVAHQMASVKLLRRESNAPSSTRRSPYFSRAKQSGSNRTMPSTFRPRRSAGAAGQA